MKSEDVKDGNTCALLMKLYSTSAATENGMAILKKSKIELLCDLTVPLWVYIYSSQNQDLADFYTPMQPYSQ